MTDELTGIHGLARRLNLPYDWLRRETREGRLPCLRIGRRLLFNIVAVRRELADRAANARAGSMNGRERINMTLAEHKQFFDLVDQLREAQIAFFRAAHGSRERREYLERSRQLEAAVDEVRRQEKSGQRKLFT